MFQIMTCKIPVVSLVPWLWLLNEEERKNKAKHGDSKPALNLIEVDIQTSLGKNTVA